MTIPVQPDPLMHRSRLFAVLLALGLLSLAALSRAQMSIHIIQRSDAAALVGIIDPLLPPNGYVNAYQGKLIIRTTESNFDDILAALGDMPDAPRTVTVHLRRQGSGESHATGAGIQQGQLSLHADAQQSQREDHYQINTLSGQAAGISQGTLVALSGTSYPALITLKQGIQVTPQLAGDDRIRLSIEQRFDQPGDDGSARIQGSQTTLMLTPGQWQPLGSIAVSEHESVAGLAGGRVKTRRAELPLEVKVEVKGL